MTRKKIIIIGGGISGLTAAYRLMELNARFQAENNEAAELDVTLLEATPRFGGMLQTQWRDQFLLEFGAESFISEKR